MNATEIIKELKKVHRDLNDYRTGRKSFGAVAFERRCQRNSTLRSQLRASGWTAQEIAAALS